MQEAKQYEVDGHKLNCPICGNDTFETRKTLLNRTWFTIFRVQPWDKTVINFVCSNCGHILPFLRKD
jgi:predicted nucleic-acid-binding Zn-ribbon protein